MNSSDPTPNQKPQSDIAQSTASRYGSDFLAAWKDSESSDNPAVPANNQWPAHKEMTGFSDICYCAQCQPVIDRLTRNSNPPKVVSQPQIQPYQQAQDTSQAARSYLNRNRHYGNCQSANTRRVNEAYHNRRQLTETPPMWPRERVSRPPRSESGDVQASPEHIITAQIINVDFQNRYYHMRQMDGDGCT